MNSTVIHEFERAGGMGGPARRTGGLAESGCQMVFISLEVQLFSVGYSEYPGYPSSGYSFAGCYLTAKSLMRCELSHAKAQDSPALALLNLLLAEPPMPPALSDSCMTVEFISVPH